MIIRGAAVYAYASSASSAVWRMRVRWADDGLQSQKMGRFAEGRVGRQRHQPFRTAKVGFFASGLIPRLSGQAVRENQMV